MTESTDAEAALYADGQCGEFRTSGSPASRVPPKTASRARPVMRNEEVAVGLADVQDFFHRPVIRVLQASDMRLSRTRWTGL